MKKFYFLFVALFITSLSFGQELLVNGDLESWDDATTPTSWDKAENIDQEASETHGGTYSAKQTASGTKDLQQNISGIVPGNSYTITVWYKVESGDGTDARLWSYWLNGSSTVNDANTDDDLRGPGGSSSYFDNNGNVWTKYETTVTAPAGVDGFRFEVRSYGSAVVYYDDLSFFAEAGSPDPALTISSPANNTVFNPGTSSVDVEWNTFNLSGGETVDITVNGSKTTNVTSPFNVATANGVTYNVTVELVDGGVVDSDNISFSVASITQVNNIAALKADVDLNGEDGFYEILSTPTITYTRASRNQKYIQDATGGILIDDNSGTITTSFSVGDGMSGLVGSASFYNGVLQFVPTQDASVSAGPTISPEVVTIANLLANVDDYESKLVRINAVSFTEAGGTFAASTNYTINDASSRGGSSMTFRTNFSEADYIGQTIPSGNVNMEVLVGEFNGTPQVTGIDMAGITLSTKENQIEGFELYPNPTKDAFVTISSNKRTPMKVSVYDILGKQVIERTITNNRLNVSNLTTGVYILRAEQDHAFTTRKLVIN